MSTPTLATELAAVYPFLHNGKDYTLSADGTRIQTWSPHQAIAVPTVQEIAKAYATLQASQSHNTKLDAADAALEAFWSSLTPAQQAPLLGQKAALLPLNEDTPAKKVLIGQLASSVTGLTGHQPALRDAAVTAINAL